MKLDELQKLWNTRVNCPTPGERDQMIARFTKSLRRRRRQELGWLVWTFFVLTLMTGFATWLIFKTDKVRLMADWAVIPMLVIPWVFACLFLRKFLRQTPSAPHGEVTISDSLIAALRANQSEQSKLKAVGLMYLIVLPVLACCLWQLHSVDKVSSRELVSMIAFLGGALALSAGVVLARYWLNVVPKGQKLQTLLSQFEGVAE